MVLIDILLGLIGLGIVILVHEAGHFISAKLSGISVEAFSLGWGKKLVGIKFRGTEYRISVLPVGGYCKLKGEELYRRAVEEDMDKVEQEPGSLFSVAPWRRLVTYFSGPAANLLFSIAVLSIIWFVGFSIQTFGNRIILYSQTPQATQKTYPADKAGLKTGDRIVEINGQPIRYFSDLETYIAPSPDQQLSIVVERDGKRVPLKITPQLDPNTGAGFIGVAAWVDPVIGGVTAGGGAAKAGMVPGDVLLTVNGSPVRNSMDLFDALVKKPLSISVTFRHGDVVRSATLPVAYDSSGGANPGFTFRTVTAISRASNPVSAIAHGATESFQTLWLTVKSIGLLFHGVNIRNTVSGPVRITYFVGEVAAQGFAQGFGKGLITMFRFLSLLSVALFFMNLLPIPALDGGLILITIAEGVLRRPVRPRIFYRYQFVGFVILLAILVLTTFNDVFSLISK